MASTTDTKAANTGVKISEENKIFIACVESSTPNDVGLEFACSWNAESLLPLVNVKTNEHITITLWQSSIDTGVPAQNITDEATDGATEANSSAEESDDEGKESNICAPVIVDFGNIEPLCGRVNIKKEELISDIRVCGGCYAAFSERKICTGCEHETYESGRKIAIYE